jgi:hypothetical protein
VSVETREGEGTTFRLQFFKAPEGTTPDSVS